MSSWRGKKLGVVERVFLEYYVLNQYLVFFFQAKEKEMNVNRVIGYLASGCSQSQVANIMGCSPGYIAQLMKDEEFAKRVLEARGANTGTEEEEQSDIQKKYTGLEHQLIKAMGDALSSAELPAITRALEVVATRQEKAAVRKLPMHHPANGGRVGNVVVIPLMLPQHAIPAAPVIEMNAKNEVVAIEGKPMAPMSSTAVEAMFKKRKAEEVAGKVEMAANQSLENALKEL